MDMRQPACSLFRSLLFFNPYFKLFSYFLCLLLIIVACSFVFNSFLSNMWVEKVFLLLVATQLLLSLTNGIAAWQLRTTRSVAEMDAEVGDRREGGREMVIQ